MKFENAVIFSLKVIEAEYERCQ